MKWSNKYKQCKECETTDYPHEAKGYCKKCYRHRHYLGKEKITRFFEFYEGKKRLYTKGQQGKLIKMRHNGNIINTPFLTDQDITDFEMESLQNYLRNK